MCSGPILWRALSNTTELPVCTFTVPTLRRVTPALMRSKSTSFSSVPRSGSVS